MKRTLGHGCIAGGLALAGTLYCNGPGLNSPPEGGGFGSVASATGAVSGTGAGPTDSGAPPDSGHFALEAPGATALPDPGTTAGGGGAAGAPDNGGAAGAGEGGGHPASEGPELPMPPAGALWAGIWDDNLNLDATGSSLGMPAMENQSVGALEFTDAEREAARAHADQGHASRARIDVALVLDTTGSMEDELDYLKRHVGSLWSGIQTRFPRSRQRWALVVYRDEGDNYVSQASDFTDARERYEELLSEQRAEGGGDLPEALDRALFDMNELSWQADAETARVAFLFTDAPHHPDKVERLQRALLDAQQADIHVYPVASSNAESFAIHTLRNLAQITGGRLVFMPAVGADMAAGPAFQPPCFFVTELRESLLRILGIELSGIYEPPAPGSLMATFGSPESGRCGEPPTTAY